MSAEPTYERDVEVIEQPLPRVLHVEDDMALARLVARMLRGDGFDVVSVETAEDAIALLRGGCAFSLVISDFNLAGAATGADVLEAAGETPFVFLSGSERVRELGVQWFDKGSVPMVAFRDAVRELTFKPAPGPVCGAW